MAKSFGVTVLCAVLLAGCAGPAVSPIASSPAPISTSPTAMPGGSAPAATASSAALRPSSAPTTVPPGRTTPPRLATATLPVKSSDVTSILMAPGPDGELYVSIPVKGGVVVTLLDGAGKAALGWPLRLSGVDYCPYLLALDDSRVRVVCMIETPPTDGLDAPAGSRIFAFDANGLSLPGWPVETEQVGAARIVGDDLVTVVWPYLGDTPDRDVMEMLVIAGDGSVSTGVEVPSRETATIGPDGLAFGVTHDWTSPVSVKTEVMAFDRQGVPPGWPITIDGNASFPAFDARGRTYFVVGSPDAAPARTVVLDNNGRTLPSSSADLPIAATGIFRGAGDEVPAPPIVTADGTTFVVSTAGERTTVVSLDPAGLLIPGWPYRSPLDLAWTGRCGPGDTGCGHVRTAPAAGSGNVLYLSQAPASSSSGGDLVAIGGDAQVRDGWPVGLRRAGSMFWSVVVAGSGELWALAVEPEAGGDSVTALSLEADSTVLYRSNIVRP
jgi:hypothetical protein